MEKTRRRFYFDYNLLFLLIFLICFGLVMLYSSSSYISAKKYADSGHYLKLQLRNLGIGVLGMAFFTAFDYRIWKKYGLAIYVGALLLCLAVFVPGLTRASHGSARWLNLGPISFQPSEFAKIAVVFFLAMLIEKVPKSMFKTKDILKVFVMMVPLAGVIAYTNLSTGIIILGIIVCMIFVASPKYKPFFVLGGFSVAFGAAFLFGYRKDRLQTWLHPELADSDATHQTMQGLYAIGSGGVFGKGLGQSLQKLGNVPESQNDFIFTIICEELGLFGAVCTVLLYILILWRMMVIANNAADMYGSLLVVGIMAHIAMQVILNIAVVTNTIPNTGVTLPFISYGGTSVAILMSEMGVVLGVSRQIQLEQI